MYNRDIEEGTISCPCTYHEKEQFSAAELIRKVRVSFCCDCYSHTLSQAESYYFLWMLKRHFKWSVDLRHIPGHRGGIGSCRIWIFLSDPIRFLSDSFRSESGPDFIGIRRNPMKSGSDLVGFHRAPLNSDEIWIGFRLKGIRQKPCWIRSVFYERCRIPMKSDTDLIENDRIYRSDRLTWVAQNLLNKVLKKLWRSTLYR